ncbi:hypothetical protein DYU11_13675 [Fibrisoma montanum]|uniref:Uncharacterized protein n=1 Tax=Fibrisoma montanum TaxID=2305895 RepID=A0A418MCA2_9BACT|nr:hypothetical protein [Fibrisoma montanum]RIV24008.1 hypothetical protein DYU11_13675 [Fibrisoma montanum]
MKTDPDFYVGWQDKAPASFARALRWVVITLAILVPLMAGLLVWAQRGFSEAVFEYGQLTTLEGRLIREPVPFLRVPTNKTSAGAPRFERVLLIGYGKHGAEQTIRQWEDRYGALTSKSIRIRGTLIRYQGHTALELTEEAAALQTVANPAIPPARPVLRPLGHVTLQGEITDPKCFLGVMKPGDGRPHRSCAIRCIAGGIPPLLWVQNGRGHANGYVLVGPNGERINTQLLEAVGRGVRVTGRLEQADNWLILYVDGPVETTTLLADVQAQIALCR